MGQYTTNGLLNGYKKNKNWSQKTNFSSIIFI